MRLALPDFGIRLGVRSKKTASLLANVCRALGASEEQATGCGEAMAAFFSDDTLLFLSEAEAPHLPLMRREKILTPPA